MRGVCAHVREQVPRLREAQRAFWLAWKAVEAGDRGALQEARRAQDALEKVQFDILRLMDVSWDASRLEVMEEKKNYRLAEQYTNPQCLPGRWVELPVGKLLEYADGKFTIWVRGHKGRYRAERFIDAPNQVLTLHAIGDNQFIVGYADTLPWVYRIDDQGDFVRDHKISTLTHRTRIHRVGRLSDGRICLTTSMGMAILANHEGTYKQVQEFFGMSDMRPAVHVGDVIVSAKSEPPAPRSILIRTPDAHGGFSVRGEIPKRDFAFYEYQPDGRLIEYDRIHGVVRCYQDDEEGAYVLADSWRIELHRNVLLLKTMQMLSYDRMLIVSGGSAEVWRMPFGSRKATRETIVKFSGLMTEAYALPNGRLVSVNEEEWERGTMNAPPMVHPMMRIRALNDAGQYEVTDEFEQTEHYDDVTPMPDGRIFVRTQNKELLIFDGDPVERGV